MPASAEKKEKEDHPGLTTDNRKVHAHATVTFVTTQIKSERVSFSYSPIQPSTIDLSVCLPTCLLQQQSSSMLRSTSIIPFPN